MFQETFQKDAEQLKNRGILTQCTFTDSRSSAISANSLDLSVTPPLTDLYCSRAAAKLSLRRLRSDNGASN